MEILNPVEIPPLEEECSQFLLVGGPNKSFSAMEKYKISSIKKQLVNIRDNLSKNLTEQKKKEIKIDEIITKKDRRVAIWLQMKIQRANNQIYHQKQTIYLKLFNIANQMLAVIDICYDHKIFCSCDVSLFQKFIKDSIQSDYFKMRKNHLKSLIAKFKEVNVQGISIAKNDRVGLIQLLLKKYQNDVNLSLDYSPPSQLDVYLAKIFQEDEGVDHETLLLALRRKDSSMFSEIIDSVTSKYTKDDYQKQGRILLSCSLLRHIFNKCWPIIHCFFSDSSASLPFMEKCRHLASLTPKQLDLSPNCFTVAQFNSPISSIFPIDFPVIDYLSELPFFTNPMDITAQVAYALRFLSEYAQQNSKNKEKEQNLSKGKESHKKKHRIELLAFEDCYSLFFAVFVCNPPSCANGILLLLNEFELTLQREMQFAQNILKACIQHVMSFDEEKEVNK